MQPLTRELRGADSCGGHGAQRKACDRRQQLSLVIKELEIPAVLIDRFSMTPPKLPRGSGIGASKKLERRHGKRQEEFAAPRRQCRC